MPEKLIFQRKLHVIFSITMVAVMGVASIAPALPSISEGLGLSKSQVAVLISAFTFPGIILTPLAGVVADRTGRKSVLLPALFIFALSGFAIYFVRDYNYMIILRVIQGIGVSPMGALNTTLIGDFYRGKQLPQAMGYNASVLSVFTAIYPLLGGALAGLAWYYPFLLPLLAIPTGLFLIFGIEEPRIKRHHNFKEYLKDMTASLLKKEVIAIFTLGTFTFIILYGAFLTYIPFLLKEVFSFNAPKIGMLLSLSSIGTAIVATQMGKLTWKFGSIRLMKTAFILYIAVCIMVPNIDNLLLFLVPVLLFGASQALNIPSLQTALANISTDAQRAAIMSVNGMVIRLGQTLGPLFIGMAYEGFGFEGAYYLAAVISLIALFVIYGMLDEDSIKERS